MQPTSHAEHVIALQRQALVAIRNRLLHPSRDNAHVAAAIAEAAHAIDGYVRPPGQVSSLEILLGELERAITVDGRVIEPGLFNAVNALRRATGLLP